jgi:hypothetical protein
MPLTFVFMVLKFTRVLNEEYLLRVFENKVFHKTLGPSRDEVGKRGYHMTRNSLKVTVFWVVVPCSLVEIRRRFRGTYCLHQKGDNRCDDGGSKHL